MNPFFNITFHILFNICCLICQKICGLIVYIFENCNNNRKEALRLFFNKLLYKVLRLRLSWFIRIVCDNYALQVLSVYAEIAKEECKTMFWTIWWNVLKHFKGNTIFVTK